MAKRKRAVCVHHDQASKRIKAGEEGGRPKQDIFHPVLGKYYKKVLTLRAYLILHLPAQSRKRRLSIQTPLPNAKNAVELGRLLDTTLIGIREWVPIDDKEHERSFEQFSQQLSASTIGQSTLAKTHSHAEVMDFAVWLLFNRSYPLLHRPPHILCHGFQRVAPNWRSETRALPTCPSPGLVTTFPNEHFERLKSQIWAEAMKLLGHDSDRISIQLILNCGIFAPIDEISGQLLQLSGKGFLEMA